MKLKMLNRTIYVNGLKKESRTIVYIEEYANPNKPTRKFGVVNEKNEQAIVIGFIRYDGGWRQYVFEPIITTKWSSGCLNGIENFIIQLNKEQREKWKRNKKIA